MDARLPSRLTIGALIRLAEGQGGFGAVLAKGDEQAGAILILLAEQGRPVLVVERVLQPSGLYAWQERSGGLDGNGVARRRNADPDLWIVELDVASAERFAAEMKLLD